VEHSQTALCKTYLEDSNARIRLHDLIIEIASNTYAVVFGDQYPLDVTTVDDVKKRLDGYAEAIITLLNCFVIGGRWATSNQSDAWAEALERLGTSPNPVGLKGTVSQNLQFYPALLLWYAGGISSFACRNWEFLATMVSCPEIVGGQYEPRRPMVSYLNPETALELRYAQKLPGKEGHYTPMSEVLEATLREPLRCVAWHDHKYQRLFDQFEYLAALLYAEQRLKRSESLWAPLGSFSWRHTHNDNISVQMDEVLSAQPADWPMFRHGLLGGSPEALSELKTHFDAFLTRVRSQRF
jgi:hypothetical protein